MSDILEEVDLYEKAQCIVDNQDGKTVARILEEFGDSLVVYEEDSVWSVDGISFDDHEIVSFVEELLMDLDEVLREQVISDYA